MKPTIQDVIKRLTQEIERLEVKRQKTFSTEKVYATPEWKDIEFNLKNKIKDLDIQLFKYKAMTDRDIAMTVCQLYTYKDMAALVNCTGYRKVIDKQLSNLKEKLNEYKSKLG